MNMKLLMVSTALKATADNAIEHVNSNSPDQALLKELIEQFRGALEQLKTIAEGNDGRDAETIVACIPPFPVDDTTMTAEYTGFVLRAASLGAGEYLASNLPQREREGA